MRKILYVVLLLGGLLMAVGSGGTSRSDLLTRRASYDLRCPAGQLTYYKIDDRTYGVMGCGQKATYVESCKAYRTECTWLLNSNVR